MSVASIQCIRITNSSSNSSNSSIPASQFRLSSTKRTVITIKCTQSDNSPLRRPSIASPPVKPSPPSPLPSPVSPPLPVTPLPPPAPAGQNVVTMEFQRQKAKEIQQYFKQKKLEESNSSITFFLASFSRGSVTTTRNFDDFGVGVRISTNRVVGGASSQQIVYQQIDF